MLRKLTVIAAILAALAIPGAAMAKHGGGGHHGGHHGRRSSWPSCAVMAMRMVATATVHWNRHNNWNNRHWNATGTGNRHWHGGHGRWWGGRWYAYGVGSCWRLVPGGWVWVCN